MDFYYINKKNGDLNVLKNILQAGIWYLNYGYSEDGFIPLLLVFYSIVWGERKIVIPILLYQTGIFL